MRRLHTKEDKFLGLHFEDPWKDWISGHRKRKEATRDVTRLSSEIFSYRGDVFPIRSVPSPRNPGYVRHNRDFFRVSTRGEAISKLFSAYFSGEENYSRATISYGNAHSLGEFFEFVVHELLIDGISIHAIEWESVRLDKRQYLLPKWLLGINPATVKFEKNNSGFVAKQRFSWIAKSLSTYQEYRDHDFKKDEIIVFKHPLLFPSSPVGKVLHYIKELRQWLVFSLVQGKANIEPKNRSLYLERSRYQLESEFYRKQNLARLKVKRVFNQPFGDVNIELTDYYWYYAYAEYKKHLNLIRNSLVDEFNNQLLPLVAKKNHIKTPIKLEYRGFVSNEVIDAALEDFKLGKIDSASFLRKIKDNYNEKLF